MNFPKKSLGQNFLIDKNIIRKIVNLTKISNQNVIEIGPGRGALTFEILRKNPKSLILIEKDVDLANFLKKKFENNKKIKIYNKDILELNFENFKNNNFKVFGNLPYNISSQILVKFLSSKIWPPNFTNLIFMFQKEVGLKIIGKHRSKDYGRLSILFGSRLELLQKFFVSPNCFFPKPKVTSIVLNICPKRKINHKIKDIKNLEKVTNIMFSNKRKMINKSIRKVLHEDLISKIENLDLNSRPSEIKPEKYYKITEVFENN